MLTTQVMMTTQNPLSLMLRKLCHLDRSRTASSSCAVERPAVALANPRTARVPRGFSLGSHSPAKKWALAPAASRTAQALRAANTQVPRGFSLGSHSPAKKWALAHQASRLAKVARAANTQVPRGFSLGSHSPAKKWALAPAASRTAQALRAANTQVPRGFSLGSHSPAKKWALAHQASRLAKAARAAYTQVHRGFSLGSHSPAKKWALAPGVCLLAALPLNAQVGPNTTTLNPPSTTAIVGGKLLTITHGTIENGTLILDHGKITAVGPASTPIPTGATIVDAHGLTVYPGLFDAETNLGLTEVSSDENSNDLVETSDEIEPQMHVTDAFHAETVRIPVNRINGVTTAIVAPASGDSIAGQDALIQLYGRDRDTMILVPDIALAMTFDSGVKRGGRGGGKFPSTRMGVASQLRQAFYDAQAYIGETEKNLRDKKDPPKRDLKLEALIPYLKGEKPVILGAEASQDVEVAMAIANEFHLKVILNHVTHAQDILDKIAAYHVPVIVGSIYDAPQANERFDAVFSLPAELQKRGVKIAFSTINQNGPVADSRNLPYAAGYAVAFGLPYDEALKAITLNPAEIFGMGDKLGSLDIGKIANVVIANGDPLDVRTDVKQVFINGISIPMTSRQTQLRDEYDSLTHKPKP